MTQFACPLSMNTHIILMTLSHRPSAESTVSASSCRPLHFSSSKLLLVTVYFLFSVVVVNTVRRQEQKYDALTISISKLREPLKMLQYRNAKIFYEHKCTFEVSIEEWLFKILPTVFKI